MFSRKSSSKSKATPAAAAGPYRKPRADLYTVLLVLALIATLVGILFLYLEMELYEFKYKGGPTVGVVAVSGFSPGAAGMTPTSRPALDMLL